MMSSILRHEDATGHMVPFVGQPPQSCWQRLLGINVLNFYYMLKQSGETESLQWLETIHVNDYVVEVSTLPCPQRDHDRIGKVVAISPNSVIIQTDGGQRVKWVNSVLLKIPQSTLRP